MKKIYLIVFLIGICCSVMGQQHRMLKGKVIDKVNKLPIPGVSVLPKEGGKGTVTNQSGEFTIEIPGNKSATLIFQYIGYEKKELVITNESNITIEMKEENRSLNEIVVVGYGSVVRRDITGAVGSVKMEDVEKAPVRSIEEALAGRVAGVQVASRGGKPGEGVNIVIRGANSLTQDNSPLWVIDGFPIENPDNNNIDPSQIESMEVLKDASATAIYGARGANGVILITTKQGKIGAPVLSYSGYYGIQETINKIPLMGPYEFVKLQNEIDPVGTAKSYLLTKTLEDYRHEVGIDWQGKLLTSAPMQNHSLSVTGGTGNTRYSFSGNLVGQEGVIINSGFNRKQGRLTLNQALKPNLNIGLNVTYNSNKMYGTTPSAPESSFSNMNYLMYSVWAYRPITADGLELDDMLTDPDISPGLDFRINPILSVENELRQRFYNNFVGNAYGEFAINKSLKLRITGGINRTGVRNETFNNSQTRYGYSRSTDGVNGSVLNSDINNWLNENTLTYNKKFNKSHSVNILGGVTFQGSEVHNYGSKAIKLPNESLGLSGLDEGISVPYTANVSGWALMSFLSRVNYAYQDKYLLTASFRADGSSKFRAENRWSYFPSAAFAWKMINEKYIKELDIFSEAKIRLSWGITGNNRVSDFASYSQLAFNNSSATLNGYYSFNNMLVQGVYPVSISNLDLKWENTAQSNIGLDLGFFKQRLTLTADYYIKNTTNLLLNALLPGTTGYDSAFKNIGKTRNSGLEITLGTVNINKKNVSWTSSFNLAFNRNRVLELTENQESLLSPIPWDQNYRTIPGYISKIGQPLGQFYGHLWDGVYTYEDFDVLPNGSYSLKETVTDNGNDRAKIKPGHIKYRDLNGDRKVDDNDRTVIGKGYPLHQGGFSNNIKVRNFDLNVFFQWSYGNDIMNANRLLFETANRAGMNQFASYTDRWTTDNTTSKMAVVGGQGPNTYSSLIVEDGSYLRLKTVSLGYNFSTDLLKKVKVKSLRVYASAQNIYTWTNYSGFDPEVGVYYSAITPGFDYSSYPRPSTLVFGLNLTL